MLTLVFGDAEEYISKINARVDAWYLDGFAPSNNADMWTDEIFKSIACTAILGTTFSTFTAAGIVRRGLQKAGFNVEKVKGFGKKREMLRGEFNEERPHRSSAPWFDLPQRENKAAKHAVVVGSGIAGITTAYALAKRGWTVDVVEKNNAIAQGGTGNPQGVVMPRISLGESVGREFYDAAFLKTLRELKALNLKFQDLKWRPCGVLQLPSSERIKKQIDKLDYVPELVRAVSSKEASELSGVKLNETALHFPSSGWINPLDLCEQLLSGAGDSIRLHTGIDVKSMECIDGMWELKASNNNLVARSGVLVLANAAAAKDFSQTSFLPLENARGQLSLVSSNDESNKLSCVICHYGYILPQINSKHLIGASFIAGDNCLEPRENEDNENVSQLNKALPNLFEKSIRVETSRVSMRATTVDRLPIIGLVPDEKFFTENYQDLHKGKLASKYPSAKYVEGLYVNVGHGARGLTSSFLAAEVIASQLNDEPLAVSKSVSQALSPSRFIIRKFKKNMLN